MKIRQGWKLYSAMLLALLLPLFWNQGTMKASAASPSFSEDEVEIAGIGETYQLEIENEVAGSTYKWSSSKSSVARVSSKGLITTVGKGSTTIKCKITFSSGKTQTLSCSIKVIIPATDIKINNAVEVNGTHVLEVGQEFNYNRDIVPSNSTDKTFWSIGGGDEGCIRIDNNSNGTITALKPGKVILAATAVRVLSEEEAAKSYVNDAIIIEVKGPSAAVSSVEIADSTVIKVVFDSPMNRNTLIDANNKLMDNNIQITMKKNSKGVMASDPGELTASLSTDMRVLTITSTNMFSGEYGINFSDKITTADGIAIDEYYKQISYIDTMPPAVTTVKVDDTGLIVTVYFNEAVDFTDFKVSNAMVLPTQGAGTTVEQSTLAVLNNKMNYTASEDKKSVTINLSKIVSTDFGKTFSVVFSGLKDMSGNYPVGYAMTAYLFTDITPKPQARPLNVVRSSYDTVTATFDRGISYPGWATVNNQFLNGVVDENDNKKVNYTLIGNTTSLTGINTVSIGYWDSYNVAANDNSASQMKDFSVNFNMDRTSPVLMGYDFNPETGILKLTYNKEVDLLMDTGIFSSILTTTTDDIHSGTNITYTKNSTKDGKVIELKLTNMTLLGNYTFTLEQGFVLDKFKNQSMVKQISITNTGGASSELPKPYAIIQSTTDLSQIYVEFAKKLDVASAENVNNYSIPGVTIVAAKVTNNTADSGTVRLTVAEGAIEFTLLRPVTIQGVKGYNGSYTALSEYTTTVELKDNRKPVYSGTATFDSTMCTVRLAFNEEVKGNMSVVITQKSTYTTRTIGGTVTTSGNYVIITLDSIPDNATYLEISITDNRITDMSGNASTLPTTIYVPVAY